MTIESDKGFCVNFKIFKLAWNNFFCFRLVEVILFVIGELEVAYDQHSSVHRRQDVHGESYWLSSADVFRYVDGVSTVQKKQGRVVNQLIRK